MTEQNIKKCYVRFKIRIKSYIKGNVRFVGRQTNNFLQAPGCIVPFENGEKMIGSPDTIFVVWINYNAPKVSIYLKPTLDFGGKYYDNDKTNY